MNEFVTVYSAELMRKLRSRPFLIGLLIGMLGVAMFIELPGWIGGAFENAGKTIVLAGDPTIVAKAKPALAKDFTIVATLTSSSPISAKVLKANGGAGAGLLLERTQSGLRATLYAKNPGNFSRTQIARDLVPAQVAIGLGISAKRVGVLLDVPVDIKTVGSKFGTSQQADAARAVAYLLVFFLYILILINSQIVMSSVAEEKTSRIAELLVASVDPRALLYGKIFAATTLALIQMLAWFGIGAALTFVQGHAAANDTGLDFSGLLSSQILTPTVLVAFGAFFIVGFLQVSTLFAAAGSLINRTEDLGSVTGPLIIPVVAALLISMAALAIPDAPWVIAVSYVPIMAPFVMFVRVAVSDVPLWQLVLSLGINVVALWGIALLAGKLYRVGMLLYGRPPSIRQVWSVIRS